MRYLSFYIPILLIHWAQSYDPTLGVNLCRLTVASYCKAADVAKWTCGPCLNSPIKLNSVKQFINNTGDTVGLIGVGESPKALGKDNNIFSVSLPRNSTMGHQKLDLRHQFY